MAHLQHVVATALRGPRITIRVYGPFDVLADAQEAARQLRRKAKDEGYLRFYTVSIQPLNRPL